MQDICKSSGIFTTTSLMWILRVKAIYFYQISYYFSIQVMINASEQARDCMLKWFVSKEIIIIIIMRIPTVLESVPDFIVLQFLAN